MTATTPSAFFVELAPMSAAVGDVPLTGEGGEAAGVEAAARRAGVAYAVLNAVIALLLIVLLLPVMLAVAAAVLLDGGPVLFRQTRVGRNGAEFRMIKFRSMVVDAEAGLDGLNTSTYCSRKVRRKDCTVTEASPVHRFGMGSQLLSQARQNLMSRLPSRSGPRSES